jgi:hypothetical protein
MKLKLFAFVLVAGFLLASLRLYAMPNLFLVDASATGGDKTWGNITVIQDYQLVANDHVIPDGHYGYVFSMQASGDKDIPNLEWGKLVSGNLQILVDQIQHDISDSEVVWIHVSWQKADYFEIPHNPNTASNYQFYHVSGFLVEAIVKSGDPFTATMLIAIIISAAFLITMCVLLGLAVWITWEIINAIKDIGKAIPGLGSALMIIIGLVILVGIGFLIFVLFGGRIKKSKNRFEIGRTNYFSFGETS